MFSCLSCFFQLAGVDVSLLPAAQWVFFFKWKHVRQWRSSICIDFLCIKAMRRCDITSCVRCPCCWCSNTGGKIDLHDIMFSGFRMEKKPWTSQSLTAEKLVKEIWNSGKHFFFWMPFNSITNLCFLVKKRGHLRLYRLISYMKQTPLRRIGRQLQA